MRIAQLHLMAYGPFRGLDLDLSSPGIHVVFGRNEAGKSTTLRAITGLLYGIDTRTLDAHVHKAPELRIGGTLAGSDGARIKVVRRKGVSKGGPNTLLDERGQAVDEAVLQRLLRGVTEETFKSAFGLDLEKLHHGAKALLDGGGDVGGSLFDASVGGGVDARGLLAHLNEEADRLYKPRATAPALNAALKAFAEAQRSVKEKQSLPEAYAKQRDALEEAKTRRDERVAKRAALATRRAQIERARNRAPLERKRAQLVAFLATVGDLARHTVRITSLHARLGAYDRAVTAHREEAGETHRLRERVAEAARRAGVPSGSAALRIDGRAESRIQRLLNERTTLEERIEASATDIERSERELTRVRALLDAPHAGTTTAAMALLRAVERGKGLFETIARHASEKAKAGRRRQEVVAKRAALGLFEGSFEALVALRLPAFEVLEELATRGAAVDRALARSGERVEQLEARASALEQELAQASGDFAPPTASDLRAARGARDEAWARVRDARGSTDAKSVAALDSELERSVRDADVLADRMIVEADRVTTLARLRAMKSTLAEQGASARAESKKASEERAALDEEHRCLWADAGIPSRGLAEMRGWLQRHAQIVDAFAAVRELENDVEDTAEKLASAREELAAALGVGNDGATLIELLDRASVTMEQVETVRRGAEEATREAARLESRLDERKTARARDEESLAGIRRSLAELVGPLGVPEDASAEEVTRSLTALRDLFTDEDKRVSAEGRAAGAADEVRAFEEESARAASDLGSDLAGLPARDVVVELAVRANKAHAAEVQLAETDAELAQLGDDVVAEDIAQLVADSDAATRAVEEVDAQLAEVDEDITKETHQIGGIENGLRAMGVESGAADASALAQEALERIRTNVERFVRARAGAVILAREIERYREENQGPMLTKASQLFARLTLGAFEGVRAGYNDKDKPAIKCVRSGNIEVDVEGLSEGTRDQLYLSLRLASLFHYADLAEPMPLVLDDVLVQFDDERSRAALQILAELSARMQVLFFTHHTRLVELARSAVPATLLTVHELTSPPSVVAPAPAPA